MLMRANTSQAGYLLMICAALLAAAWISLFCFSAAKAAQPAGAPGTIYLTQGKSTVLDLTEDVKRVSLADPEVADILLLSPRQVYLTGRKPGVTNLTLWNNGRVYQVFDLNVSPDLTGLKQTLHDVLPDERNIKVMSAGDSITLTGMVSSTENLSTAVELANIYAPDRVSNLLHVGGVQQVMLEVKVAEVSRTLMEKLGIDLAYFMNGDFIFTMLTGLFAGSDQGILLNSPRAIQNGAIGEQMIVEPNASVNGLFRFHNQKNTLTGFLDVLKQNGLVKILAEPTLVCKSGEEANFLAGGEVPIPVPQGLGTVGIEYKQFGVALNFTPRVLSDNRIHLKVLPEVSELDYSNAVNISGFTIPAITSRRASTTVELGDGQSFAIAGLLRDNVRENVNKYPILGDMPVLGALFRSSEYQKFKSELLIIVTPHLAKPLDMAAQKLPTDGFVEPSEFDFFIMGQFEGDKPENPGAAKAAWTPPAQAGSESGMEGRFGHILPNQ